MKSIYKIFLVLLCTGGLFFTSCETTELDLTANPNALTEDQASVDLFLNSIQLAFTGGIEGVNGLGASLARIEQFGGRDYLNSLQPGTLNGFWGSAYPGMFADIAAMTPLAEEQGFNNHLGVARALQAYYLITLVDLLGDVPFSQANNALEFPLPAVDPQQDVYAAAMALLDQADANFATGGPGLGVDFFYQNDFDNWRRFTNTLRMRVFLQTRLVDSGAINSFNAIVNSGNYIQSSDQDFEFPWGSNLQQPNTRHPEYNTNYSTTGAGNYRSIWLMNLMQTTGDTRIRYYFFRQTGCTPGATCLPEGNEETLQCSLQTAPAHYVSAGLGELFCYLENGYWGRQHGNVEGIPPDGFLRTSSGVYPSAGTFDDDGFLDVDNFAGSNLDEGGQGAGVSPFLLASYVDFWRAEVALVQNQSGTASALIADGLNKSITKVQGFSALDPGADAAFFPSAADNTAFVNTITMSFDGGSTEDQWNILAEQYFATLYGAGVDAYNFYRRTGFPNTLHPNLEPDPGNFPRSFFYPLSEVSSNSNITQKANLDQQVFWDNNPGSPGFPASN